MEIKRETNRVNIFKTRKRRQKVVQLKKVFLMFIPCSYEGPLLI